MKYKKKKEIELRKAQKKKRNRLYALLSILIVIIILGGLIYNYSHTPTKIAHPNRIAVIETNMGTMEFELYEDKAPLTTQNFIELTEKGFYDGLIFHRIVPNFIIQGGDPTGTGKGDAGFTIPDEFHPDLKHDSIGVLSMANRGPNTGSTQFFITLAPAPHLDGHHAVFGKLIKGEEVLLAIGSVETDSHDKPIVDVTMTIWIKE